MDKETSPLVTIIAICHKHAPYVLETLESIRKQTYSNIELIIINNVKDECEGIIQNWIKEHEVACKFIQNEVPLSITKNLNLGLEHTNGKYFQAISCDDVLMLEKIKNQVDLFEKLDNSFACIYGDVIKIDENGKIISTETVFERLKRVLNVNQMPNGSLREELSERPFIHAPSVLLRTEAVLTVGSYDETLNFEDWPMWLRLSNQGYRFLPINEVNVQYRILNTSLDRNRSSEFYQTYIKIFTEYKDILFLESKGLRRHWQQAIIVLKKEKPFAFFRLYKNYISITKDFSFKSFLKTFFA